MSRPLLALLTLTFVLSGCVTLNHRDRAFLDRYGVTGPTHDKMMHHEPLTLDDVIYLSHRGVPGPFVVHYLRPTYAVYKLTPADAARLRQSGVDEGVIRYLAATPGMFSPGSQPVWYDDGPYREAPYWDYRRY